MTSHQIKLNGPWQFSLSRPFSLEPSSRELPSGDLPSGDLANEPVLKGRFKVPLEWEIVLAKIDSNTQGEQANNAIGLTSTGLTLSRTFNFPHELGPNETLSLICKKLTLPSKFFLNRTLIYDSESKIGQNDSTSCPSIAMGTVNQETRIDAIQVESFNKLVIQTEIERAHGEPLFELIALEISSRRT